MAAFSVTKTLAAAGNYDASDIMSESASNGVGTAWRFQNVCRQGETIMIAGLRARCSEDSVTSPIRTHWFRTNPSNSELDDNAALNIHATDAAQKVAEITTGAMGDHGATSYGENADVRHVISPTPNSGTDLWCIANWVNAETAETASMTMEIEIEVIRL